MMTKLVLRGLAAHRARLLLSAVSVVVGVAFVAGTLIFSATLDRELDRAFDDLGRGTDALVRPGKLFNDPVGELSSGGTVPASVLDKVRAVDEVAKARGEVSGFAAVVDDRGRIVGPAPQVGTDWNTDPDLSRIRPQSGRGPSTPDEIAIDVNTAKSSGHHIGDRVQVALVQGAQTFTLTGIFRYGDSALGSQVAMVAFEPNTAQRLLLPHPETTPQSSLPGGFTQIVVHGADGVASERVRDAVEAVLPAGVEVVSGPEAVAESAEPVRGILKALRTLLLVFAVIAVLVGAFLIFNTFAMLVARRTRELALLRAVGASRRQVSASVVGEAVGVGLVGSTLGLVGGGGLAYGLAWLLSAVTGEELPFGMPVVPISAVIAAYAVGMIVTPVVAYIPARRAGRIPPVTAMRDAAPPPRSRRLRALTGSAVLLAGAGLLASSFASDGALFLAGSGCLLFLIGVLLLGPVVSGPLAGLIGWPFARLGGVPGRLGRRNARRSPRQTAATASALMIGLALIGTVTVLTQSMAASVNRQLEAGLTADYRIEGRSALIPVGPDTLAAVKRVPGVRAALPIRTVRFAQNDGTVHDASAGNAQELASHFRLRVKEGRLPNAENELLVGSTAATSNGWRAGRTLSGRFQDGTPARFRITGIYADVPSPFPTLPTMILNTAKPDQDAYERIDLTVAPGTSRHSLATALAPWPNLDLKDRAAVKDQAAGDIDLVLQLILVLLALSVLVAALGIVNTLALAVVERTREIGMLRAVGLRRGQVRGMIRHEALIISLLGGILGLGLGVLFGVAVRHALADQGVTVLAVPYGHLALHLVAATVIGALAAVWPAHRAARLDVLKALTTG